MNLQTYHYDLAMSYGARLQLAMESLGRLRGWKVERLELANIAGCTRQNIGMIITGAKGEDQKLSSEKHARAAAFLRVNPDWLLTGEGPMYSEVEKKKPEELSPTAQEIAELYDMIPASDKIKRAQAYNAATAAILDVLQRDSSSALPALGYQKQSV